MTSPSSVGGVSSLQDQQKFLLLLNCDKESCDCSYFVAKVNACRDCSNCGHSWFFHAVDKIRKSKNSEIRLDVVFSIASLILYATSAVPVNLKILLDRLLSKLLHSEVLQVIYALGWLYEDYVRGYKFFNQSLSQLDSWKTVTLQEEIEIIQLFINFAETNSIALKILDHLNTSQSANYLSSPVVQPAPAYPPPPTFNPMLANMHERAFDKFAFLGSLNSQVLGGTHQDIPTLRNQQVQQRPEMEIDTQNVIQDASPVRSRKYKCLQCLKTFHSINVLKLHRRSAHSHKGVAQPKRDQKVQKNAAGGVLSKNNKVVTTEPETLGTGRHSSSSPSDLSQTSPPPHEQDCKCKKCKFLFSNSKTSSSTMDPVKEVKTIETSSSPSSNSILCGASLGNSYQNSPPSSFTSPVSFDSKAAKYCNFIAGTDAIQEIRSLEALVSSVQFDKFDSSNDLSGNAKESSLDLSSSKMDTNNASEESRFESLHLKNEKSSSDVDSSSEISPGSIISNILHKPSESQASPNKERGHMCVSGNENPPPKEISPLSKTVSSRSNHSTSAKTSVIRPRMSTIKSDSQHEMISRSGGKKDKQTPVNKLTILAGVNKPRTENLSWSELKNCSLTVREKLNALVENRNQLIVNAKSGGQSGDKLSGGENDDSSTAGGAGANMSSVRSLLSCKCPKCGKIFSSPASMRVHFKNVHIREMHKCLIPGCNSLFNSVRSRNRHSMNANLHQRKSAHIHFL